MGVLADELVDRLERARRWPLAGEADVIDQLVRWIAFRENDRDILRKEAGWDSVTERYMVDPLPERLSGAFGALLFGRAPTIKTASEDDQERMDEIIRENRLHSRMRNAEHKCSSEGEVWWRIVADPVRHPVPMVTWHSRLDVIPHFVNQQLRAVGFISALDDPAGDEGVVYRHFEIHDADAIVNVLFRGTLSTLGDRVDLEAHDETENLAEEWVHDLGMMAGRVINVESDDPELGKSDYDGIEDWFLELNECLSTGKKNRALTALQRAYGPRSAVDESGTLPAGRNFLAADDDGTWGENGPGDKFGVLEFAFDAQALITWTNHVAATALSRRGITPQFTGQATDAEGFAQSGTALRMRLIPSTNEGDLRGGQWNDEGDTILLRLQQVDALQDEDHGFGTPWSQPDDAPAFSLGDPLPVDEIEDSMRIGTLRGADAISIRQAVAERNPEWDEAQVDEEVDRIKEDREPPGGGLLAGGRPPVGAEAEAGELPDEGELDLGDGVTVTATDEGFEVGGLAGPSTPE